MKIVIDAMGGDYAPSEIVKGVILGLEKCNSEVVLVGKQDELERELSKYNGYNKSAVSIVNATEVIDNNESPVFALRRKKDSSIVKALELVKNDSESALISAGSTGALFAGGVLLCGRIDGIERPALATSLPAKYSVSLILDSGANVDCAVKDLVGFANLGSAYMTAVHGIENPKVGLINNGAEEKKGNELTKATYQALKENKAINFVGNIEPRYVFDNTADVLVCDGFAGNAVLKTSEGLGLYILSSLKDKISGSLSAKIGYKFFMKKTLSSFKDMFNFETRGGAPLLGVNANIIKIHGSSKAPAVMYAMLQAEKMVSGNVVSAITENLRKMSEQKATE